MARSALLDMARSALLAAGAVGIFVGTASAREADPPRLHTNESYIEEVGRTTTLAIDDPMAVFAFVLNSLPDRVKVYPTENYYYFSFVHRGAPYSGNIRLDASDRDQGKLHFSYSEEMQEWRKETPLTYRLLDSAAGVTVEKIERFLYRVAYAGRSVLFALNDLTHAMPPAEALAPEETFVGPVADESGLRFYLVFNRKLKLFLYILDESGRVAEGFEAPLETDRIEVGKRTGYAFYRDRRLPRRILIGVYFGNARVNNHFDGPFDQLPDNFIEGDAFRDMLVKAEPGLRGKIDRYGAMPGGEQRHMIAPYFYYQRPPELIAFHRCATNRRIPAAQYYACFVADEKSQYAFKLVPLATKRLADRAGRSKRR